MSREQGQENVQDQAQQRSVQGRVIASLLGNNQHSTELNQFISAAKPFSNDDNVKDLEQLGQQSGIPTRRLKDVVDQITKQQNVNNITDYEALAVLAGHTRFTNFWTTSGNKFRTFVNNDQNINTLNKTLGDRTLTADEFRQGYTSIEQHVKVGVTQQQASMPGSGDRSVR